MKKLVAIILCSAMLFGVTETVTAKDRDTYISVDARAACVKFGTEYGICPELLMAMIEAESSGRQYATNGNCTGLMQVDPRWHQDRMERLGVTDLFDVNGNVRVAADYLIELAERYGDLPVVLMKYNGDSRAEWHYETGFVSDYAEKIMTRSAELERIHGK